MWEINENTLAIDDTEYKLTPGFQELIVLKHPQPSQWNTNDYQMYKELVVKTKVKSFPNRTGTTQPNATWKWKHMLKKWLCLAKG